MIGIRKFMFRAGRGRRRTGGKYPKKNGKRDMKEKQSIDLQK